MTCHLNSFLPKIFFFSFCVYFFLSSFVYSGSYFPPFSLLFSFSLLCFFSCTFLNLFFYLLSILAFLLFLSFFLSFFLFFLSISFYFTIRFINISTFFLYSSKRPQFSTACVPMRLPILLYLVSAIVSSRWLSHDYSI